MSINTDRHTVLKTSALLGKAFDKISREATPTQVFFLSNSVRIKSGLCSWTMSREPMDSADIVQSARTLSRVSVDNVHTFHGVHGLCPGSPWTFSRETVDKWTLSSLSGLPRLCPEYPWTLSRLSTESMEIVQGDSEQCPLSPWTLSSLNGLPGFCPEYPWTLSRLSTNSMDNVQGVHGLCPGSPWI